jgi:hypothetical protein
MKETYGRAGGGRGSLGIRRAFCLPAELAPMAMAHFNKTRERRRDHFQGSEYYTHREREREREKERESEVSD